MAQAEFVQSLSWRKATVNTEATFTKDEISLADIRTTDVILIQTLNSVYQLLVIDPVKSYAVLNGGAFRECAVDAFLCQSFKLKVGSRARLLICLGNELKSLITSTITNLTHIRGE